MGRRPMWEPTLAEAMGIGVVIGFLMILIGKLTLELLDVLFLVTPQVPTADQLWSWTETYTPAILTALVPMVTIGVVVWSLPKLVNRFYYRVPYDGDDDIRLD